MKPTNDIDKITTSVKDGKTFGVNLQMKHLEMLKEIARHYRIPNNMSHAVRLMIEDKHEELTGKNNG